MNQLRRHIMAKSLAQARRALEDARWEARHLRTRGVGGGELLTEIENCADAALDDIAEAERVLEEDRDG